MNEKTPIIETVSKVRKFKEEQKRPVSRSGESEPRFKHFSKLEVEQLYVDLSNAASAINLAYASLGDVGAKIRRNKLGDQSEIITLRESLKTILENIYSIRPSDRLVDKRLVD